MSLLRVPSRQLIIDGHNLFFRAVHVFPQPKLLVGVHTMLRSLLRDTQCREWCIVFDASGGCWRNELYPLYKANREKPPQAVRDAVDRLERCLRQWGASVYRERGTEADDTLATLALHAERPLLATQDKDLLQLGLPVFHTGLKQVIGPRWVRERYGVSVDRLADYLALCGDSSDNIPGLPGCGPKTAAKWLADRDLKQLIMDARAGDPKLRKLLEHEQQVIMSRRLVKLIDTGQAVNFTHKQVDQHLLTLLTEDL